MNTNFTAAPVYNLNSRRVSPAALLQPNNLTSRTHRRARMGAILRDERLQLGEADGAVEVAFVPVNEAA